ncbi:DUF58 domain-containing protein [Candidatus Poribacteria bacterium]|nr:DUF58 domain-containing protein [Candidatus Poribacteria bacterium]
MKTTQKYLDPGAVSRLGGMELVARLVVEGFISGRHKSPYQGFSVEFVEHRQYMPGDEIRYIDWKVYGKSDRFYIKKFEEETNLKSYILLDTSGSMAFKGEEPKTRGFLRRNVNEDRDKSSSSHNNLTKLEYSSYLTACLSYLMLKQRDSVGLVVFDDQMRTYIPPRLGPKHLHVLLSKLEKASPGEETSISATFHELAQRIVRRGLIIIISDLLDDPESVIRSLKHFRHKKHEVIVFQILDPAEISFPFQGPILFKDLETQEQLSIEAEILRDEYLQHMNALIDKYRAGCRANSIDYVLMDTSVPFDYALSLYLSKRKRR